MMVVNSPERQRNELEEKRKQYLEILTYAFDKEFPISFYRERLDHAIKDRITRGENNLDIIITPFEPSYASGLYNFSLQYAVKDACYKKLLGIFPKQTEFTEVNLNDLIFDLGHFEIYDYSNIVGDILDKSTAIRTFINNCSSIGYTVEVIKNQPAKCDCIIRLKWEAA